MSATTPPSVRSVSSGTQSTEELSENIGYYNEVDLQHHVKVDVSKQRWDRKRMTNAKGYYLLQDWETDREDHVKRLKFLTYPKQEDVILQSKLTPCSCASCTLSKQDDFRSQKSGLEEIYENHNKMHGTSHQCKFLPKFHPELNPIERVWSRLKWYLRKYNDGKLATLQLLMKKGLDNTQSA